MYGVDVFIANVSSCGPLRSPRHATIPHTVGPWPGQARQPRSIIHHRHFPLYHELSLPWQARCEQFESALYPIEPVRIIILKTYFHHHHHVLAVWLVERYVYLACLLLADLGLQFSATSADRTGQDLRLSLSFLLR